MSSIISTWSTHGQHQQCQHPNPHTHFASSSSHIYTPPPPTPHPTHPSPPPTHVRRQLRAHRENKVVLVDGNQMFNRPGPRLVDALEFLVGLLHDRHDLIPSDFPWQRYTLPPLAAAIPPARTPPLSATSPKPLSVAVGVNATQPAATTSALTAAPPLSATPAAAVAGIKEGVEEQGVLSRSVGM